MWVISLKGLVWSMNWLNCELPKNSRIAAITGLEAGVGIRAAWRVDISWYTLIFSCDGAFHTDQCRCGTGFSSNSPTARTRRLPEVIECSSTTRCSCASFSKYFEWPQRSPANPSVPIVERRVQTEFDVELQAADATEIVFTRDRKTFRGKDLWPSPSVGGSLGRNLR